MIRFPPNPSSLLRWRLFCFVVVAFPELHEISLSIAPSARADKTGRGERFVRLSLLPPTLVRRRRSEVAMSSDCLLYTSDAADDLTQV